MPPKPNNINNIIYMGPTLRFLDNIEKIDLKKNGIEN